MSPFHRRWFRVRTSPELGYAFCAGSRSGSLVMRYIDIPGVAEHEVLVAESDIIRASLPRGTRVWVPGRPFGWHPGVVRSATSGHSYHVDLVGTPHSVVLPQDRFCIRWANPLRDPALAVAHGLTESPQFYEARSDLLTEFIKQRHVSRGLSAVLSAPINLYQHQLDTVARVLADPVMRYLLADEVGLGKTIEAGLVVRQMLIDDDDARVLILCPSDLVGQWKSELRIRLGLEEHLDRGSLLVREHEAVQNETGLSDYSLIVIDEAHGILPYVPIDSPVERALGDVEGLLALSATPMRGEISSFRRLLALVDPVAFADVSQRAFETRLAEREQSAGDIQVLSARRASLRQKGFALDSVLQELSDDGTVRELVQYCRESSDPTDASWTQLSDYLREVHRLSRRMIRHRRDGELAGSYSVAGRTPTIVDLNDPARPIADAFLETYRERWRDSDRDVVFARAVEWTLAGPRTLRDELVRALSNAAPGRNLTEADRSLFEFTVARLELAGLETRFEAARKLALQHVNDGRKVVVASAFPQTASEFAVQVRPVIGHYKSFEHLESMSVDARDHAVAEFVNRVGGAVLVADASMEEGRNLQAAHVLINLDLPLDVNRLDQRIGRLDRYSVREGPAEVVVFTESDSEWLSAHVELLRRGIGVLDTSVSTVQRLLAAVLDHLIGSLLEQGADAFHMETSQLRDQLEAERDSIDLLEELESVTSASAFPDDALAELLEYESDVSSLRRAMKQLTFGAGSLALRPSESKEGVLTFGDASQLGMAADEQAAVETLLRPKAFERGAAMQSRGVAPLRIGDPLVDWLQRYLISDERGRASAVVRPVVGLSEPAFWLHSEFFIEFDEDRDSSQSEARRRRLRRRGESHFRPLQVETWTDPSGLVADPFLEEVLSRPFSETHDAVLRGKVWNAVIEAFPTWTRMCVDSADAAREVVANSRVLEDAITGADRDARSDLQRRVAILEARSRRLPSEQERIAATQDLDEERATGAALLAGIREPRLRIVASGACILWPKEDF